jgi:adenosine kinase
MSEQEQSADAGARNGPEVQKDTPLHPRRGSVNTMTPTSTRAHKSLGAKDGKQPPARKPSFRAQQNVYSKGIDLASRAIDLVCLGCPLLKLDCVVDADLLMEYRMRPNVNVTGTHAHEPLLQTPGHVSVGGSEALTARVARRLGANASLLGSVGVDKNGETFKKYLEEEDVVGLLQLDPSNRTGLHVVLKPSNQGAPAAVTFAGAGALYKSDHLRFKVWDRVDAAQVVYSTGNFLTVAPEPLNLLAEHCSKVEGKKVCINFSSPHLVSFFVKKFTHILPYTHYLIASEESAKSYAAAVDLPYRDVADIAMALAEEPMADSRRVRHVIITCADKPTIVSAPWCGHGMKVQMYPVQELRDVSGRPIARTAGSGVAGNSFAGGLLYALVMGCEIDECINMAHYAARQVLINGDEDIDFANKPEL